MISIYNLQYMMFSICIHTLKKLKSVHIIVAMYNMYNMCYMICIILFDMFYTIYDILYMIYDILYNA